MEAPVTENAVKLTPTQRLLYVAIRTHPEHVVRSYAPAKKLVELGFAEWNDNDILSRTEKGEAWYRASTRK